MTPATLARDSALTHVSQGVTESWKRNARFHLRFLANTGAPFTSDDLRALVNDEPPEPRAFGAIICSASREGWIRKTGRQVESGNPTCHARPQTEWEGVPQ